MAKGSSSGSPARPMEAFDYLALGARTQLKCSTAAMAVTQRDGVDYLMAAYSFRPTTRQCVVVWRVGGGPPAFCHPLKANPDCPEGFSTRSAGTPPSLNPPTSALRQHKIADRVGSLLEGCFSERFPRGAMGLTSLKMILHDCRDKRVPRFSRAFRFGRPKVAQR